MCRITRRIVAFGLAVVIGISFNGRATAQSTGQKTTADVALSGKMDRAFWIDQLDKLARPVLTNMAQDSAKKIEISGKSLRSAKRVLTEKQAKEIYQIYLAKFSPSSSFMKIKNSTSTRLASMYGVSPKTIRDVWNGRTWTSVTSQVVHEGGVFAKLRGVCYLIEQVLALDFSIGL